MVSIKISLISFFIALINLSYLVDHPSKQRFLRSTNYLPTSLIEYLEEFEI
jgi:hypothetical protein